MMKIFLFNLMSLFCISCNSKESFNDLEYFIHQTYNQEVSVSTTLYQLPIYQVQIFAPRINRDPFFASFELREKNEKQNCEQSENIPKLGLLQNELLSSLFFKGIIRDNEKNWALIMSPNNTIHRITEGQVIGVNHGLVESISSNGISVAEFVQNKTGCWQKHYKTLTMDG